MCKIYIEQSLSIYVEFCRKICYNMENKVEVKFVSCDNKTIKDCHFYPYKKEAIIKDIIWIIAAIGGIIVPFCFDNKTPMGAAYFLFSLSLLMEFVPKISSNSLTGRLFRGIFCALAIIMLLFSIIMVFAQTNFFSVFLFCLCIAIIVYFVIDIGMALFAPNEAFDDSSDAQNNQQSIEKQLAIFMENFQKGNLGNIEGDD